VLAAAVLATALKVWMMMRSRQIALKILQADKHLLTRPSDTLSPVADGGEGRGEGARFQNAWFLPGFYRRWITHRCW
jgi:hypothetical protein